MPPGHLLPGAEYRFQLSATRRSDGKLGYAAVDVTVNRPPYGGSLEVSPRNGTVLVDDFEVKASSWIDDNADDYPLTYTFYYRRASGSYGSEQLPLGQPGYSTVQIVQMPIAGDLEIVASVADQMRGAAITDGVPVGVAWNLTDDSAGAAIAMAAGPRPRQSAQMISVPLSSTSILFTAASHRALSSADRSPPSANSIRMHTADASLNVAWYRTTCAWPRRESARASSAATSSGSAPYLTAASSSTHSANGGNADDGGSSSR